MSPIEVELNLFVTIRSFGARDYRRLDNLSTRQLVESCKSTARLKVCFGCNPAPVGWSGGLACPLKHREHGYRLSGQFKSGEVFD